ncbi:MAG: NAD(P)H-dependent oxidoreductase subunit E [Gammaproteobacteria bacterium]|nr:NAD(P)H-dependent oxidoreductase subunit E [Gammaproteobacteria bacterium]MCY4166581.1 NAD(P)H-dependent oxidoreductase subunit E [Gammaproteobacteria bacterium]MCY4341451.1 NAD(P)H-dependent oxidoreductase subunit E [Gammaproteobacteria bacterium]
MAGKTLLPVRSRAAIQESAARFPPGRQRSAVLDALRLAQEENGGWLSVPLMDAVAGELELPPIQVYEVATFYSMFEVRPVGRHCVSVCTNISCWLRGGGELLAHLENRLGIGAGESTADGRIYLKKEEECLAACTGAPMMMVDHRYYEHLSTEDADRIVGELKR